jgi:Fe-S-cluster-containing dehydrogenase component
MAMTRREALRKLTAGTVSIVATGAATGVALSGVAHSEETQALPPEAEGLLYDATRCVGCQSCVAACAQANKEAMTASSEKLYQIAYDLNSTTRNIIKLYRPTDGKSYSYVKQQCMHCVDPACVAGCMFKGLNKDPKTGLVSWNSKLCVGCRYCEIACPYHVPKFQWEGYNPKIVKCELCKERLARGEQPACSSVCPVHAVIFGKRDELLAEAKRRIKASPGKYFQDRVYGEHEAGGTQCLYLSHVPFSNLGLPDLPDESVPQKYLKWQKRVYSYLAVPAVVYASVVGVISSSFKEHKEHMEAEEKETGLRPQL